MLKSYDLTTSPAFVVIKAAEEFKDKTMAPNQMWQTDFTYLKVTGWGWFYLSTILDDFSRYIVGWKLCTNMGADDVSATLDIALAASGCNTVEEQAAIAVRLGRELSCIALVVFGYLAWQIRAARRLDQPAA